MPNVIFARSLFYPAVRFMGCATLALGLSFCGAQDCDAQLFSGRFFQSAPRPQYKSYTPSVSRTQYRSVEPVTGYGANFHRNFTVRQQQLRIESGKPFQKRNNVLWRKSK